MAVLGWGLGMPVGLDSLGNWHGLGLSGRPDGWSPSKAKKGSQLE